MKIDNYESDSNTNNSITTESCIIPIIFGTFWLLITALCTWGFYGIEGGTIYVNGEQVSHESFNAMLGPKLLMGIFWIIGIVLIIVGIVNSIKFFRINPYGDYYDDLGKTEFQKNKIDYNINKEYDEDDPIKNLNK